MSVLEDIKELREHYKNRLNWYFAAIERSESDIQILWNEYFMVKSKSSAKNIKLIEIENSFKILKGAIEYFRHSSILVEKRLDELDKEEYAIINKGNDPIN